MYFIIVEILHGGSPLSRVGLRCIEPRTWRLPLHYLCSLLFYCKGLTREWPCIQCTENRTNVLNDTPTPSSTLSLAQKNLNVYVHFIQIAKYTDMKIYW